MFPYAQIHIFIIKIFAQLTRQNHHSNFSNGQREPENKTQTKLTNQNNFLVLPKSVNFDLRRLFRSDAQKLWEILQLDIQRIVSSVVNGREQGFLFLTLIFFSGIWQNALEIIEIRVNAHFSVVKHRQAMAPKELNRL